VGYYNPHTPDILGQEWVPIRDEDVVFSQAVNNVERGHRFTNTASRTLGEAKFYIHKFPPAFIACQTWTAAIYPAGKEQSSGPIRSVLIPCNNGGITGSASQVTLVNASTVQQALADPSDDMYVYWRPGVAAADVAMYFAVNNYAQLLTGKRILGVNFVYSAENLPTSLAVDQTVTIMYVGPDNDLSLIYPNPFGDAVGINLNNGHDFVNGGINKIALGDVNMVFGNSTTMIETIPWTYEQLQRFEPSAANRIQVHLRQNGPANKGYEYSLDYAALEVIFCEEQRISYGSLVESAPANPERFYIMGQNGLTMRDLQGGVNPTLPVGDYTLTLAQSSVGDLVQALYDKNRQPLLNGVRQLYPMPAHVGIEIRIPTPLTDGEVFEVEETDILPQLSLHTSTPTTGTITDVHVYGRQAVAQVWGTVTATQEIYDLGFGANSYPQVRFYARRFGNTTVPLKLTSASFPTSIVSISPPDFDALDELVDGWKEVTLTFPTAPTMGTGGNPQWTFSALGEFAGNRWEVLGASAPAISGVTGNMLNLAAPLNQQYAATYGLPVSGSAINLGWINGISPLVSATTDDQASDGVLIFSQNMPVISGMTVTVLNQAVTGIGPECGVNPAFIPSQIQYNRIAWPYQTGDIVFDDFNRAAASGTWGTASSTQVWAAGTPAVYALTGTTGTVTPAATNTYYVNVAGSTTMKDVNGFFRIASSIAASGADHWGAVFVRSTGPTTDQLYARVGWETDGTVKLYLMNESSSVHTSLGSVIFAQTYTPGTFINVRFRLVGLLFQAKAWIDGDDEPPLWMLEVATPNNPSTGTIGTRVIAGTGSPLPTISFDDITVTDNNFGAYELQRLDTVETDWKTIMLATSPTVTGFNDFEARIGILSSYRIRGLNVLNFPGLWSSTVTQTIPAPGVTGTAIVAGTQVMVFTSNERQNGSVNLAYSQAWEGQVSEDFTFPEAGMSELQAMYNKDFFTAFRPLERGGERFSRTLLVQAGAIAPETLADFRGLRDMAWADVSYICVRDEEGNRWLATINVPSGRVQHFRKLYFAGIEVIEVTDTPSPVDPAS
jgi:hypothetical protein